MVKLHLFGGSEIRNREHERSLEYYMYRFLKMDDRKKQYRRALYKHILPGPGIFFLKDLWKSINGFDECYPNFEEYSFELKVLEKERVFFLDKPLVKWRQRDGSLTHSVKSPAAKEDTLFFKNVRKHLLKQHHQYLQLWDRVIYYFLIEKIEFEEKEKYYNFLWLLSPIFYCRLFKRLSSRFYHKLSILKYCA